jgi:hypothetical protein
MSQRNDRRLTIVDQNLVIEMWRLEGFGDHEFNLTAKTVKDFKCTVLIHHPLAYHFIFGWSVYQDHFVAEWNPPEANGRTSESCTTRPAQLLVCKRWLKSVRSIATTRDLWAEILEARAVFDSDVSGANTPFSESEIRLLGEGLDSAETQLVEVLRVPEKERGSFRARFLYLKERLRHLGRLDYKNIFASQVLQILVDYATTHQIRQKAVQVLQEHLHYLLAYGHRLLGGP